MTQEGSENDAQDETLAEQTTMPRASALLRTIAGVVFVGIMFAGSALGPPYQLWTLVIGWWLLLVLMHQTSRVAPSVRNAVGRQIYDGLKMGGRKPISQIKGSKHFSTRSLEQRLNWLVKEGYVDRNDAGFQIIHGRQQDLANLIGIVL